MMTIKQMLEGRDGCVVFDKHLRWDNAKLSAYQEELQRYAGLDIYGIELQEDIPVSQNYHRIDHHNDYSQRPATILQVADIIGIMPDRYIQLVAANDAGYIPAMKTLNASDSEIAEIRRQDRVAQGVTEVEELLAEQSVKAHLTKLNGLLVVHALTSRFSPICDRLFPYQRLLIYTDTEWIYYGEGKTDIVLMLAEDIAMQRVYHGGGDNGYVGAVRGIYSKLEINQFVNEIKNKYGN
jgi:hypothetical protein